MKKFYLHNGTNNSGPYSKEELRELKITKETMVWTDELKDWTKAGEIDELKAILLSIPPPFKTNTAVLESKPKRKFLKYIVIVAAMVVVATIISSSIPNDANSFVNAEESSEEVVDSGRAVRNQITDLVKITTNQYTIDSFGGITNLDLIAYNNTDYTIDNLTVAIDYIKENGGIFKTEYVTFYNIPPHQDKSLSAPDSNRGTSVNTKAQTITASELQLCYDASATPATGDSDPYHCF